MLQLTRSATRALVLGVAGIVCAVGLACFDSTAPKSDSGPDLVRWSTDNPFTVTDLGSGQVPIPETSTQGGAPSFGYNDAGGQVYTATGITIPANASYRIRLQGTVNVTENPTHRDLFPSFTSYQALGDWGPGGTGSGYNDLKVLLKLRYANGSYSSEIAFPGMSGGVGTPDSALTDILTTTQAAEVYVARSGVGGKSSGVGFYKLKSFQTVSVEKWVNFLHVTANPTAVPAGQQITFTAWGDAGLQPLIIFQWWWGNDPGITTAATAICGSYVIVCGPKNVYSTGTMCAQSQYGWGCAHVKTYSSFTVDASQATVYEGDSVTFTSKLTGVATPVHHWRFVPDDSDDRVACADGSSGCRKQMTASGTMWAYLGTAGLGDSASKHVTVLEDTGCGSGGGGSLRASLCADPGDTTGAVPALDIQCTFPNGSTRGNDVTCVTKIVPDSFAFTILSRDAIVYRPADVDPNPPFALQYSTHLIADSADISVAAHATDTWRGPAINHTKVIVNARVVVGGTTHALIDSAEFTPQARSWARWQWNEAVSEVHYDVMVPPAPAFSLTPFPHRPTTNADTVRYGVLLPQYIGVTGFAIAPAAASGPNAGLQYLATRPADPWYKIYVNPWLKRPHSMPSTYALKDSIPVWQARQNGNGVNPATSTPWCDSIGLDSIFRVVKRHEGVTKANGTTYATTSHWGIGDSVFVNRSPQLIFEELSESDPVTYQSWMNVLFYNYGPYVYPQVQFDASGDPHLPNICDLRR